MTSKPHSEPRWAAGGNAEQTSWPTKSHPEPEVFWLTVEGHELDEPLVRKSALDAEHERWARAVDRAAIAESRMRDTQEQLEALKRLETFARNEAATGKSAHIRNWCSFALAAAGLNDSNPASSPVTNNAAGDSS